MMTVQLVIASNGIPYLKMRSIGSHSTSGREKGGKKERMWLVSNSKFYLPEVNVFTLCSTKAFKLC